MKLLLDQNLSRKLVNCLADTFPGSSHVQFHELAEKTDTEIWEFAKANDFCIVTQDADFAERSRLYGSPPKVIWLRCGNAPTREVEDISETLGWEYENYGSTTWRRAEDQAELEPDTGFYFQNQARVRGKLSLDLHQDPPPALAVEIDLTHHPLNRLAIYGRLGVPEVWGYDRGQWQISLLHGGDYRLGEHSRIFPQLAIAELPQVIEAHRDRGRLALRQAVRAWVQAQVPAE